ncbi:Bax inhibitor-1/YccA family protein [Puniceicoccus vermicola]|uniref:Bax inhibitor-1 family protein n=1 Tax=Puniceicoccus vermicola TaxID=388746 RepID=A0A7X1B3A3_9BACT|nr:Bax inhibitor-1 family protein [Puniceicoccus vermicola]MBC2603630.1 Bax inhibitor-1 family protein [Puniceicoccus vermicola]
MAFSKEYSSYSMDRADGNVRARFIRRVYGHLAAAIVAFALIEAFILQLEITRTLSAKVLQAPMGWLLVLGGFMIVGFMGRRLASSQSRQMQYAGLGLYIVAEAIIFAPLLLLANAYAGGGVILQAAIMTGLLFAGLTATVFITRKDFSFLGSILTIGGFVAIGLIVCATLFGFSLGLWFSVGMILFAGAAILYDTSNILHHYHEEQYVGASLELFASVALLFWYVLQLLLSLSSD